MRRRKHASVSDGLLRGWPISIGDPVVHGEHGIGRLMGLVGMDLGEGINEMMLLEYAGEARLYFAGITASPYQPLFRPGA